ncbi:MAG: RDD family protein, partial [Elainella sp. Prado103]|nr:RDD family protein [Elainella sp. Prado103]
MPLFRQIKFNTPESVELEFTLAGIGSRALALVIDYHVLVLSLVAFWLLGGWLTEQLFWLLDGLAVNYSGLPLWLFSIALLITFAIYAGYFVYFETWWQGQTPGKRLVKIRVVQDNGKPVGLAQSTLRAILRPIDDFLFIGSFLIFFGKQEKRLGDWVAGTLVIQQSRSPIEQKLRLDERSSQLAAQLPELVDLKQLQPDDFAVVSAYLHRRLSMTSTARHDLSLKLAREIRAIVQLQTIPAGLTS